MKRTIINIFKVLGSLMVGLVLWAFTLGGPIDWNTGRVKIENNPTQRTMWEQGSEYNNNQWELATGKDGQVNTQLENTTWNSVPTNKVVGSYKAH